MFFGAYTHKRYKSLPINPEYNTAAGCNYSRLRNSCTDSCVQVCFSGPGNTGPDVALDTMAEMLLSFVLLVL